ncbi:hypothetical protein [Streptomyces sp. NPDC088794]|uniref:hypothetical protein n=1 Tax=Streptomyces sp. NPDC088794 TaxID=3365902 RepID=UPI003830E073
MNPVRSLWCGDFGFEDREYVNSVRATGQRGTRACRVPGRQLADGDQVRELL